MPPNETSRRDQIKRTLAEWRRHAPFVALSFHRVAVSDPANPFSHLDTMSPATFRRSLRVLRRVFEMTTLDEIHGAPPGRLPRAVITFDDVSRTFLTEALPIIEDLDVPVAIFPCLRQTETGSGWRDVVYFLIDRPDLHRALQHRVEEVLGPTAAAELATRGIYDWTKRLDCRTDWLEHEILERVIAPRRAEFDALVARYRPYLGWQDLERLQNHRLITIGSHGARHYDFRGLTNDEIRGDISDAQEACFRRLGFRPKHFALPFGGVDQRVWQTLDVHLRTLGVKTASWCSPHANARTLREGSHVRHISRINASPQVIRTLRDCAKALAHPVANYATILQNERLAGQGDFVTDIDREEYCQFHSLLFPQKRVHQRPEYYAYLFGENPYRAHKPAHLGLRYDGNLEAMVSLFWVPFVVNGEQTLGPYISGWWRLPAIHSQIGTKPFLNMARSVATTMAGYKTSKDTRRLFAKDGWDFVELVRFAGRLSGDTSTNYSVHDSYPRTLDGLLATTNANLDFSIWRDASYYAWRFDSYPFLDYRYLVDASRPVPGWFAVVARDARHTHVSDMVAASLGDEALWTEMLASIHHYVSLENGPQHVLIETSNESLGRACRAAGLKVEETCINTYLVPSAGRRRDGGPVRTHETQAAGDALPRPRGNDF